MVAFLNIFHLLARFLAIPASFQQALQQQVRVNFSLPVNFLYDRTRGAPAAAGAGRGWRPWLACRHRKPPPAAGARLAAGRRTGRRRRAAQAAAAAAVRGRCCSRRPPAAIAVVVRGRTGAALGRSGPRPQRTEEAKQAAEESQTTETRCQRRYRESAPPLRDSDCPPKYAKICKICKHEIYMLC